MIHCWNCVGCSELAFAAELCVVQRNCDSLPSGVLCSEVVIRCRSWVGCSEIVIRCRNWVVCYELAFAAEIVAPAAKQFSLQNWLHAANQFSLPISTISLLGRNDLNASNNFMVWWCKIWNTWMWTYELLKQVWWRMWFKNTNVLICDHWCLRWCGRDWTIVKTRTTHRWSR